MNDSIYTEAVLCRYRYDALDRLAGVDSGAAESVWHFYQKSRLSVEIQGGLRRSLFQFEDQLLAEHRLSGTAVQSDLLGTDRQRSVLHTQGLQGAQSVAYGPYGHCSPSDVLPGFNGERRDPLTGHYLLGNGYRAYNPVLMRFNQPDSLSPFGRGGLNAYAYCQGDPVNRRDPGGHISILSMFEALPGEIFEHIFKHLPNQSLNRMSKTSSMMNWRVVGLSRTPKIDIADAGALSKIEMDVTGKTWGVMPSKLKRDPVYKAGFEQVASAHQAKLATLVQGVDSQMQSIIERVVRPGASSQQFAKRVADSGLDPEIPIDSLYRIQHESYLYYELVLRRRNLVQASSEMQTRLRTIRSNLTP